MSPHCRSKISGQAESALSPLPHAEHRFLRQSMPELARLHCDLTAVVRIVRDDLVRAFNLA
jgi:hypothetical protein